MTRLDKRGRRIGRNWWREMNVSQWLDAAHAREALRESSQPVQSPPAGATYDTAYYQLSDREFDQIHPPPRFKDFLIANKGVAQHV